MIAAVILHSLRWFLRHRVFCTEVEGKWWVSLSPTRMSLMLFHGEVSLSSVRRALVRLRSSGAMIALQCGDEMLYAPDAEWQRPSRAHGRSLTPL